MKDYKAAALALPTIVALTLGGVALTAVPALAEPAPATTAGASAAPVDEGVPAGEPAVGDTDGAATDGAAGAAPTETPAEVPGEAPAEEEAPAVPDVSAEPDATDVPGAPAGAEPAEPATDPAAAPATSPSGPVGGAGAQAAADPEGFTVTAPLDGALLPSAGVVVTVEVPAGSTVAIDTAPDQGGSYEVTGGVVSEPFSLSASTVPVEHVVTVQVTGPDGTDLGTVERRVVVPALSVLPAPVLASPGAGDVVVGVPYGTGDVSSLGLEMAGSGVAGATIDVELLALDPVVPWGYDDEPAVVAADGTWADVVWMPAGTWRLSAAQQSFDADGFATSLPSAADSVDVRVAAPAAAPAVEPVAPPAAGPVTVSLADAPAPRVEPALAAPRPRALASTGTDETTPWAGLVGTALVALGGLALVVARRSRRA